MNRILETITTMVTAAVYSFSFCWRNAKKETIYRIIVSVLTTLLMYLGIQVMGFVINKVQSTKGFVGTPMDFVHSELFLSVIFLVIVLISSALIGRFIWFFRNKWTHRLRFANQRELNNHRATLDTAMVRSKEYDDLSKRIQELPMSWQTRNWFSEEILNLFTTMVSFALFGASLLWYKPYYALILIVAALPMVIVEFQLVAMWWNLFREMVPQRKKRDVLERPYREVNAFTQALMFNQLPTLDKEIDINVGGVLDASNHIRDINIKGELFTHSISVISLCGILIHAIWSTVAYAGEIGTLTIIIAAARTFQGNLETIVSLVTEQWNSAKGVILIEKDFFGLKPILKTEYPVVPRFDITPPISFKNVNFSYPGTKVLVLKNVSFTIKPGAKVAIVGKSGNGKSTIQALFMRHYDPDSGSIYAGDINLRNIEPQVWSNIASSLTQEYTVLERRVGEEIASSRLDQPIDQDAVIESARFANFDEVVSSDPDGYDSQIGVEFGGRDFSGGERQRLALARVHYRGTPILILDEPDAKLDPESAQKVIDMVFALKSTVILITHHVSRAERCDDIIVMGKGEIAEQGTHDQLMQRNGIYRSMYEKDKERLGS